MRYIAGEGMLDDYAQQPVVDRFAVPMPELGMTMPQTYVETPQPQQFSLPSSYSVPMVMPQTYTEATSPVQNATPSPYSVGALGSPQTYTETPQPTQSALPSSFAVPGFDPAAFQNLDLSADAINSRISPELLQSAEARHQPQELARSKAMYQSYLNKANGDQVLANQLRAQDIIASNNARGVDPASTEREVWSILNGDKDYATDPSSPYKVQGRDLNWGIVAAMLAPAFAAQFGLLGGGAGAASGAGGAASSGGLGQLIAANNAYMSTFAPSALAGASSAGSLLGSAAADTLGGAAAVNAGNFAITPAIVAANTAALGGTAAGATTVAELVVTAAQAGMTIPQIAAAVGIPVAAATAIISGSGMGGGVTQPSGAKPTEDFVSDELVVSPSSAGATTPLNPLTVVPPVLGATSIPSNVSNLVPTNTSTLGTGDALTPVEDPKVIIPPVLPAPSVPTNVAGLTPTDTSKLGVDPSLTTKLLDWIKANPTQALSLLGGVAGAAGGASGGGTGNKYTLQNPLFKASLPKAQNFAVRTPRKVNLDWNKYAFGPEASFFTNVPDLYPRSGFKRGGHAVNGPGTGRSDSIDAKLSDGEYVIDAETVALLGDGSSKAGADQLDKFRVNIRKHKGRALSKGKFSVNAKAPEAYLAGGRR